MFDFRWKFSSRKSIIGKIIIDKVLIGSWPATSPRHEFHISRYSLDATLVVINEMSTRGTREAVFEAQEPGKAFCSEMERAAEKC